MSFFRELREDIYQWKSKVFQVGQLAKSALNRQSPRRSRLFPGNCCKFETEFPTQAIYAPSPAIFATDDRSIDQEPLPIPGGAKRSSQLGRIVGINFNIGHSLGR
jgi:hypothetical protein